MASVPIASILLVLTYRLAKPTLRRAYLRKRTVVLADLRLIGATRIWSLETESPQLWSQLTQERPEISDLFNSELKDSFPVAPTLEPFDRSSCVRPAGHHRAYYIRQAGDSVIAVKGSEVATEELNEVFTQALSHRLTSGLTLMEHFPRNEQKLPYVVLVSEAVEEARLTVRFLEKYVRHFKTFPLFPVHLAVYRVPGPVESRYFATLDRFVSDRTRQRCRLLGQQGLAVYVYYFPALPLRIAHIVPAEMRRSGIVDAQSRERVLKRRHGFDGPCAASHFLTLAGRMLSVGFFPLSMASRHLGNCTNAQNVTLHGGMVDSGSITPFERLASDWDFTAVFLSTLSSLCLTTKVMLWSPLPCIRFEHHDPSVTSLVISELVWERVRSEMTAAVRSGLDVDPRLQAMLAPPSFGKVCEVMAKLFPTRTNWRVARHLVECELNLGLD